MCRECPEELREAISGLIFAASRFGEFPELQQLRDIFTSRYGKDFTVQCVELSKNCGVHPKVYIVFNYSIENIYKMN